MLHGIALRYFLEVARTGSLAASSENLHVAVSAISRQIAKLEDEVGTPLFERMPRGMVFTDSGQLLAEHARRALLDADAVLSEISEAHALGRGIVRSGAPRASRATFCPACSRAFTRSIPERDSSCVRERPRRWNSGSRKARSMWVWRFRRRRPPPFSRSSA